MKGFSADFHFFHELPATADFIGGGREGSLPVRHSLWSLRVIRAAEVASDPRDPWFSVRKTGSVERCSISITLRIAERDPSPA
jgi:hypothetical protein